MGPHRPAFIAVDDIDRVDEPQDRDGEACFLQDLADRCVAQRLAPFDMTARERPSTLPGWLGPLDQQHLSIVMHHGAHANKGTRIGFGQLSR
jgi:hypothetical protein